MANPFFIYRKESLQIIFNHILSGDSCVVVAGASMGKTRFIDCMMLPEVREQYLGSLSDSTILLRADCNRLAEVSDWGIYELILTALIEGCGQHPGRESLRMQLNGLRQEVITAHDAHLALRNLELAVMIAIQEHHLQLHFLLDEFDEAYGCLPELALDNLRALRDAHKYRLSYSLFFRQPPALLRDLAESESFYELFSRSVIGLTPYSLEDTLQIIERLESRKQVYLEDWLHNRIAVLSGGHPGLILALFDLASETPQSLKPTCSPDSLLQEPIIKEECRKLWQGLHEDEKFGLHAITQSMNISAEIRQRLRLKGLIHESDKQTIVFNEIFASYITSAPIDLKKQIEVNQETQTVVVEGETKELTAKEFDLINLLATEFGRVFTHDEIVEAIYPNEAYATDNQRLDALIKRLRKKIEPEPSEPRYLITKRGRGYFLAGR